MKSITMASVPKEENLDEIFDCLTPLEWMKKSEEGPLQEQAALRQWKKITEFDFLVDDNPYREREDLVKIVQGKEFEEMLICFAPFIKTLKASSVCCKRDRIVHLGNFWYKVDFFNIEKVLKILAEKATEITEVKFDKVPEQTKQLKRLFKNNKIKKFSVFMDDPKKWNNFLEDVPTDDIEELKIRFDEPYIFLKSFKGHFSNLQKLKITMDFEGPGFPKAVVSKILPHVSGLRSLTLKLDYYPSRQVSSKLFWDITKFSRLEELNLSFPRVEVKKLDRLIEQIVEGCSELQIVKLEKVTVTDEMLHDLLTLPKLQRLQVDSVECINSALVPELKNLMECSLTLTCESVEGLCKIVKQSPVLETLSITLFDRLSRSPSTDQALLNLVCALLSAATSKKSVDIYLGYDVVNIKIERKIVEPSDEKANRSLRLLFTNVVCDKEEVIKDVELFVERKLKSHCVTRPNSHL